MSKKDHQYNINGPNCVGCRPWGGGGGGVMWSKNWDRILARAVKGLISRAGIVSICPLL